MKVFTFLTKEEKYLMWWYELPTFSFGNSYNKSVLTEKYFGKLKMVRSLKDCEIELIYTKEKRMFRELKLKKILKEC